MKLLNENEINVIVKQFGLQKSLKWQLEEFSDTLKGFRADHLMLMIEAENEGVKSELKLFVKCMPRFDKWKSKYLRDLRFFCKEYNMLSKLFREFENGDDHAFLHPELSGSSAIETKKWRPKLLFVREDLFVFEDVSLLGYLMPSSKDTMTFDVLIATVKTVATFHAQSYIYEERKSKELGRPYRIWDEFSEYLQESVHTKAWRDTGKNAVIDYLKVFSKHKLNPNFIKKLENVTPTLYERSLDLMKPSPNYRNVVVHRDLWSNNIFIKKDESSDPHALIIDFETVIYCSPMLDLSSLIYFNTSKADRDTFSGELIEIYYNNLSSVLQESGVNINTIFPKDILMEAYNESLIFGMTQASLIVPIISMSIKRKEEIFCDPIKSEKANLVSRSDEFIEIANEDPVYRNRLCQLLDEMVERFIYPDD